MTHRAEELAKDLHEYAVEADITPEWAGAIEAAAVLLERVPALEAVLKAAKEAVSQIDQARHMLQSAANELQDQDYESCAKVEDREWLLLRAAIRAATEG